MAQVEYKARLAFHAVEQTVNAFFNNLFIGIQNMRIKVTLYRNTLRSALFDIQQVNIPVDRDHIRLCFGH